MNENGTTGGIGFVGALSIVFIVLKLCGVINWSWIWVLSPLWLPLVLIGFAWLVVWFFGWLIFRNRW